MPLRFLDEAPTQPLTTLAQNKKLIKSNPAQAAKNSSGFFGAAKDFIVGMGKSALETTARLETSGSLGGIGKLAAPFIPEKVKLPILGETSLKYSKKPGTALMQVGEDILNALPGSAEAKPAAVLIEEGTKGVAGKLIKSAFKIGLNDLKKSPGLVKDFLVERISGITKRSIAGKAEASVNALEGQLDDIIRTASKEGRHIDASEVAKATKDLIKFYENSAFPEEAEAIRKQVAAFVKRGKIPVEVAQEFKKNTYAVIRKSYGQLAAAPTEGAKQLARGVKQELEKALPEFLIQDINKKLAIFGKARDLMMRQIEKAAPHELVPLKDIVIAGATHQIWPALARRVIESVPFKTYLARILTSTGAQTAANIAKISAPITKELIKSRIQEKKQFKRTVPLKNQ